MILFCVKCSKQLTNIHSEISVKNYEFQAIYEILWSVCDFGQLNVVAIKQLYGKRRKANFYDLFVIYKCVWFKIKTFNSWEKADAYLGTSILKMTKNNKRYCSNNLAQSQRKEKENVRDLLQFKRERQKRST